MPQPCALKTALRAVLCIALVASPFAAIAQNAPAPATTATDYVPTMTFDVATIHENEGVVNHQMRVNVTSPPHSAKFSASNLTLKAFIQMAYGFGTPISGGPDFLTNRYFNIEGKSDHSADDQLAKLSDDQARLEKQHMLQTLLTERLHLKYHMETRESSVYTLSIAKNGLKMHETKPPAADSDQPQPTIPLGPDVRARGSAQGLEFTCTRMSMKGIAGLLTSQLETPIVDKTGLAGSYDFTLQMGRDWSSNTPDAWPDIFTAVQEQLGLKLESTKAPIPVLIIDHIELPSAN